MAKNAKYLNHFKKADSTLFDAAKRLEPLELTKSNDYFYDLCRKIIGQQLSVKVASVINARFLDLFSGKKITPDSVLKIPDKKLREIGTSWTKASYIKDLASKAKDGSLNLKVVDSLDNAGVIEVLTQVKGIGPWSAEMFLMFSLAREDIFSHGDLGLRRAIEKLYTLDNPPMEQVEEISGVWAPYRTYACMVLWRSLDNAPK